MIKQLILVISFSFVFIGICQTDFNNYQGLNSEGPIPKDFLGLATTRYQIDLEENTNEDLDKDFFLSTRFYIDDLLLSGRIIFNEKISNYLSEIGSYLLRDNKELRKKLRFYVITTNSANAFSTDQGIILFTTGLLAKLESEAQIAFILAHEISHYTEKHVRKGYVEYQDYEKSKGKYRRLSYYDAVNRMSTYNQKQELEADLKGIELYLNSEYDPLEIKNSFLRLYYSHLPFKEKALDPTFFNTEFLTIPSSYYPDTTKKIDHNIDYDATGSTHPNIKTRIEKAEKLLEQIDSAKNTKFYISEETFYQVQETARFESINLDIMSRYYADALFTIYLLCEKHPDNRFLDISKVKALYGLAKYRNRNRFEEVTTRLKDLEGEKFAMHAFFKKLSREQLNIIVYRHLYDMHLKYAGDDEFLIYYEDFRREFALNSSVNFDMLQSEKFIVNPTDDTNQITFNIEDSLLKIDASNLSKNEKLQRKKDLLSFTKKTKEKSLENNFHMYALCDLVKSTNFIDEISKLRSELTIEYQQTDTFKVKSGKNISNKASFLGVKNLIIVDPIFEEYNTREDLNYKKSELRKIAVSQVYKDGFSQLDLRTVVLDSKDLNELDVEKYNEISLIKNWMSEILDHDDIDMICSSHYQMKSIIEKYGTSTFLFTGLYRYKKNALGLRNPYEMVSFVLNAEEDELKLMQTKKIDMGSIHNVLRVHVFDLLNQISHD